MRIDLMTAAAATIQEAPRESTIVQAIWLAAVIIFVVSWITTGFTANRIENLHNPTYGKAFLSQLLIGPFSLAAFVMFGLYFQAPLPSVHRSSRRSAHEIPDYYRAESDGQLMKQGATTTANVE